MTSGLTERKCAFAWPLRPALAKAQSGRRCTPKTRAAQAAALGLSVVSEKAQNSDPPRSACPTTAWNCAANALRGRVVVLHAFQRLCLACMSHRGLQARRLHRPFPPEQRAVVGAVAALQACVHADRSTFPIGIDRSCSWVRCRARWSARPCPLRDVPAVPVLCLTLRATQA
ncbi:MAG TPA: hypothetical protein VMS38_29120 [Pseudorhodoferax sp.]|nr:hypothetical protein [Pseudorhodoferax sp.]